MDERLQFVARRLAGEGKMAGSLQGVWDLAQDRLQNLRVATRSVGCKG